MGFFEASGFESRYEPLRDEEIVVLARRGVRSAAECLMFRYRPLVEFRARNYFAPGADHDDIVQEGMIGLFEAIRDYREDERQTFRPFADLCVTRQIQSAVRASRRQKHLALNAAVVLEAADESSVDRFVHQPSDMYIYAGSHLHSAMSALTEFERAVLRDYAEGRSYREMSERLACATKSIDNALQRAKRKLAQAIGETGMVA